MPVSPQTFTKNDVQKGTLAELPPNPLKGDFFLITDKNELAACFDDGIWTRQPVPVDSPITADNVGNLLYNDNPIFITDSSANKSINSAAGYSIPSDSINLRVYQYASSSGSFLLSTSSTVAGLSRQNILTAGKSVSSVLTSFKSADFVAAGTTIYAYRSSTTYDNFETLLANLSAFTAPTGSTSTVYVSHTTIKRVMVI